MAEGEGAAPQGVPATESGATEQGAGTGAEGLRGADGHEKPSQQDDRTGREISQINKSLQIVLERVEHLGQRFEQHVHQPVEVHSDAAPQSQAEPATAPEAQPASAAAQEAAPTPKAETPPPAPKRATGVGPMKHRAGRRG